MLDITYAGLSIEGIKYLKLFAINSQKKISFIDEFTKYLSEHPDWLVLDVGAQIGKLDRVGLCGFLSFN